MDPNDDDNIQENLPIGMDLEAPAPTLRYQLLQGQVYSLQIWTDGSTMRGQVPISELEDRVGVAPGTALEEGWYNAFGEFMGDDPKIPEPPAEPAFPRD